MRGNPYSEEQIRFLKDTADDYTVADQTVLFNKKFNQNRTRQAISCMRTRNLIKTKNPGRYRIFKKEQIDYLRSIKVNTEKDVIKLFYEKFGIELSKGQLNNLKHRYSLQSGLVGGWFQKGRAPSNKGKKWDEFMSKEGQKNSLKTTFRKGNIPPNRREISSERITKDGYIEVKIADGHLNKNWKLKHRLVWEQNFGEIPKGHKIVFLDGNRQNCAIDNLALVKDNAELVMNRRRLFSSDAEHTQVGINIANLQVAINNRRRKDDRIGKTSL